MRKIARYLPAILMVILVILFLGFKKNISLDGLHVYNTQHFTIYYEELDRQTLKDIEGKLETNYSEIQSFFSLNDKHNVKVIVYENIERFQRAYLGVFLSYAFGDWTAGAAYEDMVLLTSPENPGPEHTYASILDISVHEYIHTLVFQVNPDVDIWLDEGTATYLARQESDLATLSMPTFEQIQSQSQGEFVENDGYAWAPAYVEYLVTTYGAEKVVNLIRTNDYEECLGKSKLAVYKDWTDYVESK